MRPSLTCGRLSQLLDEAAVEEDIAYAMEPLIRKDLTQYIHRAGLDSMLLFQARPEDSSAVAARRRAPACPAPGCRLRGPTVRCCGSTVAVMVSELYRNVDTQEWDPLMTWELEDVQLQAPVGAAALPRRAGPH